MSNKNDLDGVTPAKFSDDPGSAIKARKVPLLIGGGLLAVSLVAGGIVASTLPDNSDTANNASVVDIQASEDEPDYKLEEVPALKERGMDKNVPGIRGIPGVQPKDIPPITKPSVADAPILPKPTSTKTVNKPKPSTAKPTKERPTQTKTEKPNPPKPTYTPPTKEPTYTPPAPTTTIPPITPTTTTPSKPTTSKPTTTKPTTTKPTTTSSKPTTTTSKPTTTSSSTKTSTPTKTTSTSSKPSEDPKSGPVVEYKVRLSGLGEFEKISYIDKNGKEKNEKTLKGNEWNLVQEFEPGTPRAGVKVKGDGPGVVSCVVLVNGKEVARDIGVLNKDVKCEVPTEVVKKK